MALGACCSSGSGAWISDAGAGCLIGAALGSVVVPANGYRRFVENVGTGRGEVEVPLAGAWFKFVGLELTCDSCLSAAIGIAHTKDICQAIAGKPISKLPLIAPSKLACFLIF